METQALHPLWKALSDPSRRRILDLLRERPRTTGELGEAFEFTRFAVMKHLKVLEEADLITVRRKGRERWNHLNAVPLQSLYERWIRPFEAEWATSLLRLKAAAEDTAAEPGGTTMPQSANAQGAVNSLIVEQEITIKAPRDKVFDAMTGDVSAWWGRPYIQDTERVQGVTIEARLGGHFIERWDEEDGAIWGTITNFKRGHRMIMIGSMAMGGAVHGMMRFDLEDTADGKGTVLKLSHHAIGEVNDELQAGYGAGWTDLLDNRLRAFVERGERLGLGHEPPME